MGADVAIADCVGILEVLELLVDDSVVDVPDSVVVVLHDYGQWAVADNIRVVHDVPLCAVRSVGGGHGAVGCAGSFACGRRGCVLRSG